MIFASGDDIFFECHTTVDEDKIKNIYLSMSSQTCSVSHGETIKEVSGNMDKIKADVYAKIK